jgi:predicted dehydrogenase
MGDPVKRLRPPRVLVVGYGAFGKVHAQAWARIPGLASLAIAERDPATRATIAEHHAGVATPEDWRAALADADIVDAVAPTDLNPAIVEAALDAGCDVFAEKPFGRSGAEADRLAALAATRGAVVQTGFVLRFHPLAQRMAELLRAGALGRLSYVAAEWVGLKLPRRDAGVVLNDVVHFLDLVLWHVGAPPRSVQAALASPLGRPYEDIALAMLRWPDGLLARIEASCVIAGDVPDPFFHGAPARKRLSFTGDEAQLDADFVTGTLRLRRGRHRRDGAYHRWSVEAASEERFAAPEPIGLVAAEFQAFLAARVQGRAATPSARDGALVTTVCDAIFAAAARGAAVTIEG